MKKLTMVIFTKMWELFNIGGQTYPWVVPLGTSHPKISKPTQLQNNVGPIPTLFINFISKDYLNNLEFESLIEFLKLILIECSQKKFERVTSGVLLFKNTKGTCLLTF
jgi:hypothetical protein